MSTHGRILVKAEERLNNIYDWSTSSKDLLKEEKEIKKWVAAKKSRV